MSSTRINFVIWHPVDQYNIFISITGNYRYNYNFYFMQINLRQQQPVFIDNSTNYAFRSIKTLWNGSVIIVANYYQTYAYSYSNGVVSNDSRKLLVNSGGYQMDASENNLVLVLITDYNAYAYQVIANSVDLIPTGIDSNHQITDINLKLMQIIQISNYDRYLWSKDGNQILVFRQGNNTTYIDIYSLCPIQYYLTSVGNCQICHLNCSSCNYQPQICTFCVKNSLYLSNSTCLSCSDAINGCKTCQNFNYCLTCTENYYFLSNNTCIKCYQNQNCIRCISSTQCLVCNTQKNWKKVAIDGVCQCANGYTENNLVCTESKEKQDQRQYQNYVIIMLIIVSILIIILIVIIIVIFAEVGKQIGQREINQNKIKLRTVNTGKGLNLCCQVAEYLYLKSD